MSQPHPTPPDARVPRDVAKLVELKMLLDHIRKVFLPQADQPPRSKAGRPNGAR